MRIETINIKYFKDENGNQLVQDIEEIEIGNYIDLRCAEDIDMKKFDFKILRLGVAMELPCGYEAHVVPRSSTYKNFKIILANSEGIIDNPYCGDNDEWRFPAIALEDTHISKGDRICQFRIMKIQPKIKFNKVDRLNNEDRNGIGSTGIK